MLRRELVFHWFSLSSLPDRHDFTQIDAMIRKMMTANFSKGAYVFCFTFSLSPQSLTDLRTPVKPTTVCELCNNNKYFIDASERRLFVFHIALNARNHPNREKRKGTSSRFVGTMRQAPLACLRRLGLCSVHEPNNNHINKKANNDICCGSLITEILCHNFVFSSFFAPHS